MCAVGPVPRRGCLNGVRRGWAGLAGSMGPCARRTVRRGDGGGGRGLGPGLGRRKPIFGVEVDGAPHRTRFRAETPAMAAGFDRI